MSFISFVGRCEYDGILKVAAWIQTHKTFKRTFIY